MSPTDAIRAVLSADLLSAEWRAKLPPGAPASFGHCYAAAEALYHTLGGKAAGLTPMVARTPEGTHWWLRGPGGAIIDPTADQFTERGMAPPYPGGRPCGFLTLQPSRRAQRILARVKALCNHLTFTEPTS
jgi:hypothetical protein